MIFPSTSVVELMGRTHPACRGGEVTMDISADLTEFSRSDVAVVCAGAKSVSLSCNNSRMNRSDEKILFYLLYLFIF
jgi:hypothetical protein